MYWMRLFQVGMTTWATSSRMKVQMSPRFTVLGPHGQRQDGSPNPSRQVEVPRTAQDDEHAEAHRQPEGDQQRGAGGVKDAG